MLRALLCAFVVAGAGCEPAVRTLPAGPNAISFTVKTEPSGAMVVVDGVPVGKSPVTLPINPGPHRVKATMSGYYPAPETKIQVGSAEPKEMTIPLVASH